MIDSYEALEATYDRYDDNGVHDAATLRHMVGMETPDASEFTAEAIKARNPELNFAEGAKAPADPVAESAVPPVTKDDLAHYGINRAGWEYATGDDTGQRRVRDGVAAARLALEEAREDRNAS